jgi:hypothetical protein
MSKTATQFLTEFAADLVGIPTIVRNAMKELGPPLPLPDDSTAGISMRHCFQWDSLFDEVPGAESRFENWSCDISDVFGLSASKSDLEKFNSLEEMVKKDFPSLLRDVSHEGLNRLMQHDRARNFADDYSSIFRMNAWDGRIYLSNDGGSRHFAAAQFVAAQLGEPVRLTGKLIVKRLDYLKVSQMNERYASFRIPDIGFSELEQAVRVFGRPSGGSPRDISRVHHFPRGKDPIHSSLYSVDMITDRGRKIAEVMMEAGHINVLAHLKTLCLRQGAWQKRIEEMSARADEAVQPYATAGDSPRG